MSHSIKTLSLSDAKIMARAAEDCAAQFGIAFSIAIVDCSGHLLHFTRGDGGVAGCVELAINKAFTAIAYGLSTAVIAPLANPGGELYGIQNSLNGRAVIFGGGIPVYSNGAVIGAVGASAGTVDQDISVALAAISALTDDATSRERDVRTSH